jgi:hypothetical protein
VLVLGNKDEESDLDNEEGTLPQVLHNCHGRFGAS